MSKSWYLAFDVRLRPSGRSRNENALNCRADSGHSKLCAWELFVLLHVGSHGYEIRFEVLHYKTPFALE